MSRLGDLTRSSVVAAAHLIPSRPLLLKLLLVLLVVVRRRAAALSVLLVVVRHRAAALSVLLLRLLQILLVRFSAIVIRARVSTRVCGAIAPSPIPDSRRVSPSLIHPSDLNPRMEI